MRDESAELELLRHGVMEWARIWDVPRVGEQVVLRTSTRLRRSLGSYRSQRSEITLAAWLLDGPERLREEVLCHEAAHAAVHFVHGRSAKPHGREWREFMRRAGMTPRVRIPFCELPESRQALLARTRVWKHRCPVCGATRFARTRVTRWRCGGCWNAGRSGALVIERLAEPRVVNG